MKPAIQGEFFIKIGVVCLGATILIGDVMKSGVFSLIQRASWWPSFGSLPTAALAERELISDRP